jgi:hypothetical protein
MDYLTAIKKKQDGDWKTVGTMLSISPRNASVISRRPNSKKYKAVMDALVSVVQARESLLNKCKDFIDDALSNQ